MNRSMINVLRRTFALFVVAGLLLVAAPRALAVPPAIGESGISGQVLLRTLCPGDGPARDCFQPTEANVSFQPKSAVGATIVARTDAQGIFATPLAPGLYKVWATTTGLLPKSSKAMLVRVYPGFMVGVRIVI